MDYTEEFETFWSAYPKRWNRDLGVFVKRNAKLQAEIKKLIEGQQAMKEAGS